jgi:DNA-binding transcriptional LysR family regulator
MKNKAGPTQPRREADPPSLNAYRLFAGVCETLRREYPKKLLLRDMVRRITPRVSAPRASELLREIEDAHGKRNGLIDRSGHQGCVVTPAGWSVYRQVRRMLDCLDAIGRVPGQADREIVTVASGHAIAVHALTPIVKAFRERDDEKGALQEPGRIPARGVEFVFRNVGHPVELLKEVGFGDASIGVTVTGITDAVRNVELQEVSEFVVRDVLLLPPRRKRDPFAALRKKKEIRLKDLERYPVCVNDSPELRAHGYTIGDWGSGRKSWMWSPSIEMVAAAVSTGEYLGVAASWRDAYGPWEKEVEVRPIKEAGPYKVAVCLPIRPAPSGTVNEFKGCIGDFFRSVPPERR